MLEDTLNEVFHTREEALEGMTYWEVYGHTLCRVTDESGDELYELKVLEPGQKYYDQGFRYGVYTADEGRRG